MAHTREEEIGLAAICAMRARMGTLVLRISNHQTKMIESIRLEE